MENKNYYITYSDRSTDQKTIEGVGLNDLLNQLQITDRIGLLNDGILTIFHHTADKQSHVFLDFAYSKFARIKNARTPVYGVKGKEWKMFRPTHYSQIYLDHENELFGPGFTEHVFGRDYLTENECVDLSRTELEARGGADAVDVSYQIPSSNIDFLAHLMDQICTVLEKNAQTRIVLLIEHEDVDEKSIPEELIQDLIRMIRERDKEGKKSEDQIFEEAMSMAKHCMSDKLLQDKSLKLMQEVYLLLPHRLRLQNGFMTCVTEGDLDKIISKGWPIYITTADRADFDEETGANSNIAFIALKDIGRNVGNPERVGLLRQLAQNMNQKLCTCFSFAEQEVLKEREASASSFKYYEEIIRKAFDSDTYWWNRTDINTVEELFELYNAQLPLMNNGEIECEAIRTFYMERVSESTYADQVISILRDEQYPEREKYLEFLGTRLYAGTQINAVTALIHTLEQDKAAVLEQVKASAENHEKDALQQQKDALTVTFDQQIREQQSKYEEKCAVLDKETELARDLQGRLTESENFLEKLRSKSIQDQKEITELTKRLRDSGALKVEALQKDMARTEAKLKEERRRAESEIEDERGISEALRKKKNLFLVLMIVGVLLASGGIGGAVYGFLKATAAADTVSQLESEKQELENEYSAISESNADLINRVDTLESEKENIENEWKKQLERMSEMDAKSKETENNMNPGNFGGETAETDTPDSLTSITTENGVVEITYNGDVMHLE